MKLRIDKTFQLSTARTVSSDSPAHVHSRTELAHGLARDRTQPQNSSGYSRPLSPPSSPSSTVAALTPPPAADTRGQWRSLQKSQTVWSQSRSHLIVMTIQQHHQPQHAPHPERSTRIFACALLNWEQKAATNRLTSADVSVDRLHRSADFEQRSKWRRSRSSRMTRRQRRSSGGTTRKAAAAAASATLVSLVPVSVAPCALLCPIPAVGPAGAATPAR
jgi:hypothetical protein